MKKRKEIKYKLIETAPCPYAPIGKGLAIVDIEMLQQSITKAEKRMIEELKQYLPLKFTGILNSGEWDELDIKDVIDLVNHSKQK